MRQQFPSQPRGGVHDYKRIQTSDILAITFFFSNMSFFSHVSITFLCYVSYMKYFDILFDMIPVIFEQAITRGLRPMFGRVIFINIKWIFLVQGDVCGDLALIPTLPLSLNSSDLTITNVS